MPTYPYLCEHCGHRFELFQKITDQPVKDCPACHVKDRVQRQIGGGSALLRFQGSGFYETDYRRPAQKSEEPNASPSPKKGGCGCGKPHGGCGPKSSDS